MFAMIGKQVKKGSAVPNKNQYYASTGVVLDGGVWPSGDSYDHSGLWNRMAPSDKGGPARQYLQRQCTLRHLAPDGTCPPLGGLQAYFIWWL